MKESVWRILSLRLFCCLFFHNTQHWVQKHPTEKNKQKNFASSPENSRSLWKLSICPPWTDPAKVLQGSHKKMMTMTIEVFNFQVNVAYGSNDFQWRRSGLGETLSLSGVRGQATLVQAQSVVDKLVLLPRLNHATPGGGRGGRGEEEDDEEEKREKKNNN